MKKENNNNNQNQNRNQSTQIIATVLAIAILIVAVVGISFAAFTYTKAGEKENTITTGTITMNYTEGTKGIKITDAYPVNDAVGKAITESELGDAGKLGEGGAGVFDFNVSAKMTSGTINYDVIGRKAASSDLSEEAVKLYLQKSSTADMATTEDALTPTKFSELPDAATGATTDGGKAAGADTKELYTGSFTGQGTTDYYRLRMWVAEDFGSSDAAGSTFDKAYTFTVTVDVYGQAAA